MHRRHLVVNFASDDGYILSLRLGAASMGGQVWHNAIFALRVG